MSWKKAIYIGILFCAAMLFQNTDTVSAVLEQDSAVLCTQTDFLAADDGTDHEVEFNDQAITPLSGNAISGRNNSGNHLARILTSRRLQARNAFTADLNSFLLIGPGNFTDHAFVLYPSGRYSTVHHLIGLRKLII